MNTPQSPRRGSKATLSAPPLAHSITGACHQLGVGRTKVYELINRGDLETAKVDRRRLVTHRSIEALLERYRVA
ncbi:MAG: Helix-turn-helix domain [Geminicoccaceae bacterium]|jgi:excisionase family DNA binding protein|nr:Helix-turn-helix domain [Geminicoccaceae bacterium]MCE3247014.1 Helix-turn-helix domain [Geminicoccaceae bacterium]